MHTWRWLLCVLFGGHVYTKEVAAGHYCKRCGWPVGGYMREGRRRR